MKHALLVLIGLAALSPLHASTIIPVANHTFSDASNFIFTADPGNLAITSTHLGKWVSRENNATTGMLIEDITDPTYAGIATYTQDGSTSMMFRSASERGLAQLIDVSGYNMMAGELTLSALISGRGNADPHGIIKMAGYNTLSGLTVDLGGKWDITGGTPAFDFGETVAPNSGIQGATVSYSLSGTATSDFDYLLILVGGDSGGTNQNTAWVGVDNVQLSLIPEPSSMMLVGFTGLFLLIGRRR